MNSVIIGFLLSFVSFFAGWMSCMCLYHFQHRRLLRKLSQTFDVDVRKPLEKTSRAS